MAAACAAEHGNLTVAVSSASSRWRLMLHSPKLRPWYLVETSGSPMQFSGNRFIHGVVMHFMPIELLVAVIGTQVVVFCSLGTWLEKHMVDFLTNLFE